MKTSSKVILENIKIDKELRINVALVNDKQLTDIFNDINQKIDELNTIHYKEQKQSIEKTITLPKSSETLAKISGFSK